MDTLLRAITSHQPEMLAMLRSFVEAESPSTDKSAVDRCGRIVGEAARELGALVRYHGSRTTGDHLRAEFRFSRAKGQILVLGHLDTVWNLGTLKRMPFRIRNGCAYGPGVFDMKSGIVIALFALRILRELGVPLSKNIVLLLNADEEIGSPSSRRSTEAEARRSSCALVVEPPHGIQGALKTSRKGVGDFELRVHGRAAHAGLEPEMGASAVSELCRQITRIESFSEVSKGITLSAGVILGGTRSNVIPAEASAQIDVRIRRAADAHRIEKRLRLLRPYDRRTKLEVSGGFNRPPFERTRQVSDLFERARRLALPLGIRLTEAAVGGGSDGNFTAALGVPTLDGLGVVGEGAHAAHENVVLRELPRRAALLAHLIASLASE